MTLEPHDAYTVQRRPLLPPKPERILPQPKLSMAEDAKMIRRRYQRAWGSAGSLQASQDANDARKTAAMAARKALAEKIIADLSKHPRTTGELIDLFGSTQNAIREALTILKDRGLVHCPRVGRRRIWEKRP